MTHPPAHRRRRLWQLLTVLALALQCHLLYSPSPPGSSPFPHADKLVPFSMFAGVCGLAVLAGLGRRIVLAVGFAHGVLSEIVQELCVDGRSGSVLDLAADATGVIAGTLVGLRLLSPRGRLSSGGRPREQR